MDKNPIDAGMVSGLLGCGIWLAVLAGATTVFFAVLVGLAT
jgi:hypothetical protein